VTYQKGLSLQSLLNMKLTEAMMQITQVVLACQHQGQCCHE